MLSGCLETFGEGGWPGRGVIRTVVEASLDSFMWTPAPRRRHSREHLRYASDVSDEEWLCWSRTCRRRA